jgi:hypothetical protein
VEYLGVIFLQDTKTIGNNSSDENQARYMQVVITLILGRNSKGTVLGEGYISNILEMFFEMLFILEHFLIKLQMILSQKIYSIIVIAGMLSKK